MLRVRSRTELLSEEKQQQQQQQRYLQQQGQQQQQQPQLQTRPRKPRDAHASAHNVYLEGNLARPPAELAPAAPPEEEHPRGYHTPSKRLRSAFFWMYYRAVAALRSRQLRTLCATLVTFLLIVWLLRTPARLGKKQGRQLSYAVYIDGGSSGTRVHVFEYRHSLWPAYVQLNLPEKIFSVEPGLSSYAGKPEQAAGALRPLLEFAYQQVPESQWSHTPVHLMTTAGLRLLPPADADAILQACTQLLASSRFVFRPRWARIIDGDDEGLYAWAAANYVSGALEDASHHHHSRKDVLEVQSQPSHFNGVLELGGASFQITFMPSLPDSTVQHSGFPVPLPGITRPLFTHSYLGLGMDAALRKGTSIVLSQHAAAAGGHDNHEHCTMDGVYVPPVAGTNFLAIENFFWTARALGLGPTATLAEVQKAGQEHCALPWSDLHHSFAGHVPHKFITRYCFGAAYVVALLHDRLGVGQHDRCLHFTNSISRPVRSFDWGQEEDEEEHRDGDDNESDYNRGHNNMDSTSSSDSASGAAGGGDQGVKTGGDRVLRAAAHSGEDGVIGVAGSGGPPPTVAVGLSWVVGAMVVETMHSRYGDHPGFLFEGGLGEFEHGVQVWLKHHVAMMLLAGGGLALMLLWRGWRTLTVLRRGTRGLVGFGKGDGGSYVGKQAEEVRVL